MTPLGRAVFVIGLLAWLIAALSGWKEFAIVAGICLIGVLTALAFTFGRTQLDVTTILSPKRVVAGDTAVAEVHVTNTATRRMLPVRLEIPINDAVATVHVPTLASGETFEEVLIIPTTRRCVLTVGPTRSVRGDPLGMMRREVAWADADELFVHPKTSPLRGVSSGWLRDLEGQPTNDRSPSDVAFHTLREYVPGDDRRHVHWRTSARINKLMVRQFIDNRRSHLGLVIDTNPASYADNDEFELAVSMAGSLGLRAINEGQEVSCVAGSYGVASHNGQSLLDGLARVELGVPTISLQETAMRAAPMLRAASIIAVITGSALASGDLPLAARRFGFDVQMIALRADLSKDASLVRTPQMLTLSADTLDSLTRVMWSVSGA
ncbi:MAG: DUF58 domain-containing protein [Solirubrobacterales bacterium]